VALTPDEKLILIVVLAASMIFIVFFELRVMRGRNREVKAANLRRDEAFNIIVTTQSVLNVVERRGTRVPVAKRLMDSARDAQARGDHDRALELCDKAKAEIANAEVPERKVADAGLGPDLKRSLDEVADEAVFEEVAPVSREYKGVKLEPCGDPNYLSAKFEIGAAESEIEAASGEGRDVSSARSSLAMAKEAFDSADYSRALSLSLKAMKKASAGGPAKETISLRKEVVGPDCPSCGEHVNDLDAFCGGCGAKVERKPVCRSCGFEPSKPDVFCRRCGSKVE
jgi:hypothetical protein